MKIIETCCHVNCCTSETQTAQALGLELGSCGREVTFENSTKIHQDCLFLLSQSGSFAVMLYNNYFLQLKQMLLNEEFSHDHVNTKSLLCLLALYTLSVQIIYSPFQSPGTLSLAITDSSNLTMNVVPLCQ